MRCAVLLTLLCALLSAPVSAAHYHLKADGSGAYATIQAAINAASSGDTIICADGTYQGAGNYSLNFGGKNLILKSESNHPNDCIIRSNWTNARVITFSSGESSSAIVQGFTMEHGYGVSYGGGVYIFNSSPTIVNCIIQGNTALTRGGGMYIYGSSANPSIVNCIIVDNATSTVGEGLGGGMYLTSCYGLVENTNIVDNITDYGGGVYNESAGTVFLNDIVYSNSAYYSHPQIGGSRSTTGFDYCLIEGYTGLPHNFDGYPWFTTGPGGEYYLATTGSGSICINAGSDLASNICYTGADGLQCLSSWTTRIDQQDDAGQVDVGYHYPHYSATIAVPSYKPTIQAAIDAAWDGDIVSIADGTYTGDGNRDLDTKGKRVTVRSQSGNANNCIINCQGSSSTNHRGFYIRKGEGSQTVIQNLKITGGYANYGAGINISSCSPTVSGCILSGNHATIDGGGIMNYLGTPTVTGCTFISNSADDAGGGMLNHTCSPVITNCWFESNTGYWGGGGMYNYHASPTLNTCTFKYNSSSNGGGGGVHSDGTPGIPILNGCVFQENQAPNGGGMYSRSGAHPVLTDCRFVVNSTIGSGRGGGLYATGSNLDLVRCTFDGNETAVDGGAVYCTGSANTTMDSCVFFNNSSSSGGGAIYYYDHQNSMITNCTFYHNESPNGGALWLWLSCSAQVDNCIFWENRATTAGSQVGINNACTLWMSCNDILYGQSGIYVGGGSSLTWGTGNFDENPMFCHPDRHDFTIHSESPCAPAHSGGCGLVGAKPVGCTQTDVAPAHPSANRLYQSYPNPFNPATRIAFDVSERSAISLRIYDVTGRLVRVIAEKTYDPGRYEAVWDGLDNEGRSVASGAYFCRMTAGTFTETRKMVLLR